MKEYDHKIIEPKWQNKWDEQKLNQTNEEGSKPKMYVLDMFPYPSGEGLHTGHTRIYTASDVYSRLKRMQGYSVLHPTGWDAFGLPAEQYAIKNKIHPSISVKKNTDRFRSQMSRIAFSYDWQREINTTDPEFYKWTQWIFKQLFKNRLAYESYEPINWCPVDKTGLSNEDLEDGKCERCGSVVEKRPLRQWVLSITKYADRLVDDLELLDQWPKAFKESQRNWIGRSSGAEINFKLNVPGQPNEAHQVTVFTTRPDTLFGATFLAISHELAEKWINLGWKPESKTVDLIASIKKDEEQRAATFSEIKEKIGIFSGIYAINPANGESIPVWIANYVLSGYGTGAIMAVPAHDERDYEFARKYDLPIREVIQPKIPNESMEDKCWTDDGVLINSGEFSGMDNIEAKQNITLHVSGRICSTYKLKDWVFARQRYWGEPFPIVFDGEHNAYCVSDDELPVKLPEVEHYEPTDTGESPLATIENWVNVYGYIDDQGEFRSLPKSDPKAKLFTRETNTMPQWAGSSWYYLRFMDPSNTRELVSKQHERNWSPVDVYVGGAEHATRHLIYARFWHKFLFDIGVTSSLEPFTRLEGVGLVLGEGGIKMSKRLGNVINPDEMIDRFGADTLRLYEMFMGPFGQAIAWSTESMMGTRRMVERIWRFNDSRIDGEDSPETLSLLHQSIRKVTNDIESFAFNTAISQLMIMLNHLEKVKICSKDTWDSYLKLIAPFAPHVADELWEMGGKLRSIHQESWPTFDEHIALNTQVSIAIQVNGKTREVILVDRDSGEAEVMQIALSKENVQKWLNGKAKRVIFVKNRILNLIA